MTPSPEKPERVWRREPRLRTAVLRYLTNESLSNYDVGLIRTYLAMWIESPYWDAIGVDPDELKALREAAPRLTTYRDIHGWIEVALDWDLDPL